MEELKDQGSTIETASESRTKKDRLLPASILVSVIILAGAWIYTTGLKAGDQVGGADNGAQGADNLTANLEEKVLPAEGLVLPVRWGDLGAKMAEAGVIDAEQFEALYASRGGLTDETKQLLYGSKNGNLVINQENAGTVLNLLWALGLGNKNEILEKGPMSDPSYGGAGNFASTGGWTLAKGDAMDHYSEHSFLALNAEQQALAERVSKNIYRPCCGNSTYFPDCNHGMAMLGLLELMAAQGVSEKEMYKVALQVNSYWFPDTYLAIATYLDSKGTSWAKADPKELLGANFSSASGYRRILSEIQPQEKKGGGGGCGV